MFDPASTLSRLGFLAALVLRLFAPRGGAVFERSLVKLEGGLAAAVRATEAAKGVAASDISDTELIVWFARRQQGATLSPRPATLRSRMSGIDFSDNDAMKPALAAARRSGNCAMPQSKCFALPARAPP